MILLRRQRWKKRGFSLPGLLYSILLTRPYFFYFLRLLRSFHFTSSIFFFKPRALHISGLAKSNDSPTPHPSRDGKFISRTRDLNRINNVAESYSGAPSGTQNVVPSAPLALTRSATTLALLLLSVPSPTRVPLTAAVAANDVARKLSSPKRTRRVKCTRRPSDSQPNRVKPSRFPRQLTAGTVFVAGTAIRATDCITDGDGRCEMNTNLLALPRTFPLPPIITPNQRFRRWRLRSGSISARGISFLKTLSRRSRSIRHVSARVSARSETFPRYERL